MVEKLPSSPLSLLDFHPVFSKIESVCFRQNSCYSADIICTVILQELLEISGLGSILLHAPTHSILLLLIFSHIMDIFIPSKVARVVEKPPSWPHTLSLLPWAATLVDPFVYLVLTHISLLSHPLLYITLLLSLSLSDPLSLSSSLYDPLLSYPLPCTLSLSLFLSRLPSLSDPLQLISAESPGSKRPPRVSPTMGFLLRDRTTRLGRMPCGE